MTNTGRYERTLLAEKRRYLLVARGHVLGGRRTVYIHGGWPGTGHFEFNVEGGRKGGRVRRPRTKELEGTVEQEILNAISKNPIAG